MTWLLHATTCNSGSDISVADGTSHHKCNRVTHIRYVCCRLVTTCPVPLDVGCLSTGKNISDEHDHIKSVTH
jgi:hypothetical protein